MNRNLIVACGVAVLAICIGMFVLKGASEQPSDDGAALHQPFAASAWRDGDADTRASMVSDLLAVDPESVLRLKGTVHSDSLLHQSRRADVEALLGRPDEEFDSELGMVGKVAQITYVYDLGYFDASGPYALTKGLMIGFGQDDIVVFAFVTD